MAYTAETLQALAAARAAVARLLDSQATDLVAAWLSALDETRRELERAVVRGDYTRAELLRLSQRVVAEQVLAAAKSTGDRLTHDATLAVQLAGAHQEPLIATQLPPPLRATLSRPPAKALAAIVQRTTQQVTVRSYYLSVAATRAAQQHLRLGVAAGMSPRETAARMVRAVDGDFHGALTRALVIARTETLDAYRASAYATDQANSDILAGWQWYAKLDTQTCISCVAQHGRTYDVDDPGPHDHHQGRCTRLPKTKSWQELGYTDVPEPKGLEVESGAEWFARLPESEQLELLGPKRYDAWRAGAYPPEEWSEARESDGWRTAWHSTRAPKEPPAGWRWPAPPPTRPLTPQEKAHFYARQQRIPYEWHGETLEPREVEFVERMHARGEVLEWLPKPKVSVGVPRPSSNDFIWRSKGLVACELKSTNPRYESIKGAVSQAVKKAKPHGVAKEHFVIDLGVRSLSSKLRGQLAKYNERVRDTTVSSIWVLSEDGKRLERVL